MEQTKIETHPYIDLKSLCIGEFFSIGTDKPIVVQYGYITTNFGIAFVGTTDGKLSSLEFMEGIPAWKGICYVRDDAAVLSLLRQSSIDVLLIGTPFQVAVWRTLVRVASGMLVSYSELAVLMGRATAVRAVASAVARNKIGYFVPCHRVVRSNGDVGQFRWSPSRKVAMIENEKSSDTDLSAKIK